MIKVKEMPLPKTRKAKAVFFTPLAGILFAASVLQADNKTTGTPSVSPAPSIRSDFSKTALPILRQSCFACHGPQPQGTDGIQDPALRKKAVKTIAKAQNELRMDITFPFPGSDNPKDDLKDMVRALQKGWMPPEIQKVLKFGQPLSAPDKKILLDWAFQALKETN